MSDYTTQNVPYYIYFAGIDTGYTKIGISSDPQSRLIELQVGNPHEIKIYSTIKVKDMRTAQTVESMLHSRYASYRGIGEWFSIPVNIVFEEIVWCMKLVSLIKDESEVLIDDNVYQRTFRESQATKKAFDYLQSNPEAINISSRELAVLAGVGKTVAAEAKKKYMQELQGNI